MKCVVLVTLLASFVAFATADCDGLSPALCGELETAARSISHAIETYNDVLATAVTEAAETTATLYQASFNLLKTSLPPSKARTADDVLALQEKVAATLQQAQASQDAVAQEAAQAFEDASSEVTSVLEEAILAARDHDSAAAEAVAFAVGGSKMEALKKKLEEALKQAHGKLKEVIKTAIDKITSGMSTLEGFFAKLLGEAGIKKVQELLTIQVERLIKLLGDALAKKLEGKTENAFAAAVEDTELFITDLEAESRIMKRSTFWEKVQAAVARLNVEVRAAALKVLAKHKPIILKKLQEVGQAVINAGKDVVLEVVNGAIKAVVQS